MVLTSNDYLKLVALKNWCNTTLCDIDFVKCAAGPRPPSDDDKFASSMCDVAAQVLRDELLDLHRRLQEIGTL